MSCVRYLSQRNLYLLGKTVLLCAVSARDGVDFESNATSYSTIHMLLTNLISTSTNLSEAWRNRAKLDDPFDTWPSPRRRLVQASGEQHFIKIRILLNCGAMTLMGGVGHPSAPWGIPDVRRRCWRGRCRGRCLRCSLWDAWVENHVSRQSRASEQVITFMVGCE